MSYDFDSSFDITPEERAIIASLIDEDERLKKLGFNSSDNDNDNNRPLRLDGIPIIRSMAEEVPDRIVELNSDDETDRHSEIHLIKAKPSDRSQLRHLFGETIADLNQEFNIEDSEHLVSSNLKNGPSRLIRQPSYYVPSTHNSSNNKDNARTSYGFTYKVDVDGFELEDHQPFCFHWVGEVLQIKGNIYISSTRMSLIPNLIKSKQELFSIKFLSAMVLSIPGDSSSFYRIDDKFLYEPFPVIYQTDRDIVNAIGAIHYDKTHSEYYVRIYRNLADFPGYGLTYAQILQPTTKRLLISIDTSVHLSLDPDREL